MPRLVIVLQWITMRLDFNRSKFDVCVSRDMAFMHRNKPNIAQ